MLRYLFKALGKKMVIILFCFICVFIFSGCRQNDADSVSQVTEEKNPAVTCFGTVSWRESCIVSLPFEIYAKNITARPGQILTAGDTLMSIDEDALILQCESLKKELDILELKKVSYENELEAMQNRHEILTKAVDEFSAESVMEILQSLSENRYTTSKRNEYRMELIDYLGIFDLLDYYDELNGYALSSDKFYIKTFNPRLETLDKSFDEQLYENAAQIGMKSAMINELGIDISILEDKIEQISGLLENKMISALLYAEKGTLFFAQDGYMIDDIKVSPNSMYEPDLPLIGLIKMDSLEVTCYLEEQLVGDISLGDEVILHLYADNTVLEMGTVDFISQKALSVNGETMAEIIISYEGDSFLPGYNIVAKIKPAGR
jgi:multidrug resistance efflux pump